MASQIIYEWGTCTGAIRRHKCAAVNIEIMQHVFVIKTCWRYWSGINIRNYRHGSLKYGGILNLTDLWWRILPKLMPSLANDSFRKECLSISTFLILTGLKSMWPAISKMIAVSFYSLESKQNVIIQIWYFDDWKIICPVWWTNVSTDDRYSKLDINCVPLLAILLRHAYEAYFCQGLLKNKNSTKP